MTWNLTVIIICILLSAITAWLEYRRSNGNRLISRIIVSLIAIAALACLTLPVTYQGKSSINNGADAALLTPGYHIDSLSHSGAKLVFATDKDVLKSYPKAIFLNTLQDLNIHYPAIKQLHILGYGLGDDDLKQLDKIPVIFHAPPAPGGILTVNWQKQVNAGELLQVQGKFNNASAKPVRLLFKGLNTPLDSVNIPAGKITDFELTTVPKTPGNITYTLLAIDGRDTIENESVPVTIERAQQVKVLILASSPGFETRFLKNWLSQNGYAIAVREAISKDKISEDFINTEKQSLAHLSAALLNKFDVVIGDLSALKALNNTESSILRQQVSQSGLGIIIRSDSLTKGSSWLQNNFKVTTYAAKTQLTIPLAIQDQKVKTAPLNIDPSYISNNDNVQNLLLDLQNRILASSAIYGTGKLVYTTLHNTYTWQLAGNNKDYTALWSILIGKAARKLPPEQSFAVASAVPTAEIPVQLQLQSSSAPVQLAVNGIPVSAVQDAIIPFEWKFDYWPQNAGWQQAILNKKVINSWYLYQKDSWTSLKHSLRREKTQHYLDNRAKNISVTKQIQNLANITVPKMYFYSILIAACAFLWIERKL